MVVASWAWPAISKQVNRKSCEDFRHSTASDAIGPFQQPTNGSSRDEARPCYKNGVFGFPGTGAIAKHARAFGLGYVSDLCNFSFTHGKVGF